MLIGEVWLPDAARLARYVGPDELHTVFNFPYLNCPWDAAALRQVIDADAGAHAPLGAPATWVLSNHDVDRVVSRYGRADTAFDLDRRPTSTASPSTWRSAPAGPGRRRCSPWRCPARVYIYQGEELGLWEVQDIPDELRQDPIWAPDAAAPTPAGTAAGCRCRGPGPSRRSASPRAGAEAEPVAAAAQGVARPDRGGRVGRTGDSMLSPVPAFRR